MEPCSRSVVLSSQVLGGMWKRNGYSILNQALHYQLHLSRGVMYDKDIVMLQVANLTHYTYCVCVFNFDYVCLFVFVCVYVYIICLQRTYDFIFISKL